MQKLINPVIFAAVTQVTGLLVMAGYLTPKGQDAINQFLIFVVGSGMVLVATVISHLHHAEISAQNASLKTTTIDVKTTSPSNFSQANASTSTPVPPAIAPAN